MADETRQTAPTLEDVARVAGVSRATVSRVVNGKRKVSPSVQEAVLRAVAETGYVPNRAARTLVTRRTGTVAVVVSGTDPVPDDDAYLPNVLADPFFGRVVGSFVRSLRPHDVHPVLMVADTEDARQQVLSYVRFGNADGTLLVSTHPDDPLIGRLVESGRPVVLFARPPHPVPVSWVDVANAEGGGLAADRLVERGCRHLGAISGPLGVAAARERLAGFRDALARHGLAYVPATEGNFTYESGEAAMRELLADVPDLDGVFVGNDLMALGAIDALRAAGRDVPGDVAVIGFDDSSVGTRSRPTLTTVRQPVEQMAAEMARMLLEQIDADAPDSRCTLLEPTLVVRESA